MQSCLYCGAKARTSSRIPKDYSDRCSGSQCNSCAACQKLKALDEKIHDARAALDRLLDEREALASVLNDTHDPLTKHMPVELISRIFKECVPTWESITPHTALLLTQICRRWRIVGHNTPTLWSTIGVSQAMGTERVPLGVDEMLEACLVRSGDLPLSIHIVVAPESYSNPISFENLRTSVALMCRHAQRWHSLNYDGKLSLLNTIAASTPSFDKLKELIIYTSDRSSQHAVTFHATLSYFSMSASPKELGIHVDYHGLTRVMMNETETTDCIELFREATHLEICDLGNVRWDFGTLGKPRASVVANSLRELSIHHFSDVFWDLFNFPSLLKLEVGNSETGAGWAALKRCFVRSHCRIQKFTIMGRPPSNDELIELLSAMPQLRELYLGGDVTTSELFSKLYKSVAPIAEVPNPEQFLSQLTTFTCSSRLHIAWGWAVLFLNAMTSRREQTLTTFTFTCFEASAVEKTIAAVDKRTLEHLLIVAGKLKFKMAYTYSTNILHELCKHHGVDFPTGFVL